MPIEVTELNHVYSIGSPFEQRALDTISLTISDGEFFGIIGHTGSGKSTLAESICGLTHIQSGGITIDGLQLHCEYDKKQLRRKVGMVFQYAEQQLFEDTVIKDVCFGPKNQGLDEEQQMLRARRALELMGLDESFEQRSPTNLSGGEKRRVAMAGVIAMQPKYLLLDEPSVGLDPQGTSDIMRVISRLHDEQDMTVVMITHSMDLVARLADRIAVLHQGKVVRCDAPGSIFADYEFLAGIGLDVPEMVRLGGQLKQRGLDVGMRLSPADMAQAIAEHIRGQG